MQCYKVAACPSNELAVTNRAILNPDTQMAEFAHIAIKTRNQVEAAYVFSVITDRNVKRDTMAFNQCGRKWASLMINGDIEAAPYQFDPRSQCLNSVTFSTDFVTKANAPKDVEFNTDDMSKQFSQQFVNQALTVGQLFGFSFVYGNGRKVTFELVVKTIETIKIPGVDAIECEIGLTTANTVFIFERAEGSDVALVGGKLSAAAAPQLFNHDLDFAKMGIGGLSAQYNRIFRRAFASRLLPPRVAEAMGEEHVRGMLLYGPPGTGKTLIARQIGKSLFSREPKIVNGPEVLNKFVGESEANIRKLFADAEEEQKKMGIMSGLHVIIFDEIDAICKARGNSAGSSGVGDNVVNQLLSKIDGVDSLHNVLLIGMTNRKDLIDEALLRPGRLELQIEIGLPNKEGRVEILGIHTKKMRENNKIDPSVDLMELAERTKNFTGAELAGLIRAARSLAVNRVVKPGTQIDKDDLENIKVTRSDFIYALEHDVKPALGVSEDTLGGLAKPMIPWDRRINEIQTELNEIINQLSILEAEEDRPYYTLLSGESGAGLTTIAANMARKTKFPFIRVYEAKATAGKSEVAKIQYLEKLFSDASRSELSCIVIDGLEVILGYIRTGPRYLNDLLAVLIEQRNLILPPGHRMLVICTCDSESLLEDLMLKRRFDRIVRIPSIQKPEQVDNVLVNVAESGDNTFTPQQRQELIESLGSLPFKMGIKKLKRLIKDASQTNPNNRVRIFLERMHTLDLVIRHSRLDQPFEF